MYEINWFEVVTFHIRIFWQWWISQFSNYTMIVLIERTNTNAPNGAKHQPFLPKIFSPAAILKSLLSPFLLVTLRALLSNSLTASSMLTPALAARTIAKYKTSANSSATCCFVSASLNSCASSTNLSRNSWSSSKRRFVYDPGGASFSRCAVVSFHKTGIAG